MQSSIFHAYVRLARNAYPGISHQHDDESMFYHAVEHEESSEILHELKHGLIVEETNKLIEFRRKQRKNSIFALFSPKFNQLVCLFHD